MFVPNDKKNPAYLYLLKKNNCEPKSIRTLRKKVKETKEKIEELESFAPLSYEVWLAENKAKMEANFAEWADSVRKEANERKALIAFLPSGSSVYIPHLEQIKSDSSDWVEKRISEGPGYSERYRDYANKIYKKYAIEELEETLCEYAEELKHANMILRNLKEYFQIK